VTHRGEEILSAAQEWPPAQKALHITHREALASALGTQWLMQGIPPGCILQVQSDAVSKTFCWQKGSKMPGINVPIAQQCKELAKRNVIVLPSHIRGVTNCRGDWLSRNPDPRSYALSRSVFLRLCRKLQVYPELDLFANRKNRQTTKFCSWRTDPESLGNAFPIHWGKHLCWIIPPDRTKHRVFWFARCGQQLTGGGRCKNSAGAQGSPCGGSQFSEGRKAKASRHQPGQPFSLRFPGRNHDHHQNLRVGPPP